MTRPAIHTCAYCCDPIRDGKSFIAVRDPGGVSGLFCDTLCFDAARLRAVLVEEDLVRADYARASAAQRSQETGGLWA